MLKKFVSAALFFAVLQLGVSQDAQAQKRMTSKKSFAGSNYTTAVGMHIDFGSGGTWVGPAVKHFFNENSAGEAQLLFASGSIVLGAEYQYNAPIPNAGGLNWYAGLGPAIAFATGDNKDAGGGTDLMLRPLAGLDYKIDNVPLNFAFDWRPAFFLTHGTTFTAARFGLGMRYAF